MLRKLPDLKFGNLSRKGMCARGVWPIFVISFKPVRPKQAKPRVARLMPLQRAGVALGNCSHKLPPESRLASQSISSCATNALSLSELWAALKCRSMNWHGCLAESCGG